MQAMALVDARLEPLEPYPGRNSIGWRCRCLRCDREVRPTWGNLQRGQGGCRYCAGQAIDDEKLSAAMLAAGVTPVEPYPGRNTQPWRCRCLSCGREVTPSYSNVQKGQGGCKYCAGRGVHPAEAEQAMRDAGLAPIMGYPGAGAPWPSICLECGRTVSPRYANIRSGQGACGFCSGVRVDSSDAVARMREAGLEPLTPYPGAAVPWLCRCQSCGREVTPTRNNVTTGNGGCKFCAKVAVDPDEAARRMLLAGLLPLTPYPGSSEPWLSECRRCGRQVTPRWDDVVQGGRGCRACAGNAPVDPELAAAVMQEAGVEPLVSYPGANNAWPCRCLACGRDVTPAFSRVRDGGVACRYCAHLAVDTSEAVEIMLSAKLRPLDPFPGTAVPWRCLCEVCGREVSPRYSNVRIRGRGCMFCAAWGFDYSGPAIVYLIHDAVRDVRKIGIAGEDSRRITDWKRHGWTVERTWRTNTGVQAHRIEQAVLAWWRGELGLLAVLDSENGWTETVSAHAVSATVVIDKVEQLMLSF